MRHFFVTDLIHIKEAMIVSALRVFSECPLLRVVPALASIMRDLYLPCCSIASVVPVTSSTAISSGLPWLGLPRFCAMPKLTRRYPERPDCWHIYFGDVRVGGIGPPAIRFHNARLIYVNVEGDWSKFYASSRH